MSDNVMIAEADGYRKRVDLPVKADVVKGLKVGQAIKVVLEGTVRELALREYENDSGETQQDPRVELAMSSIKLQSADNEFSKLAEEE